MIAVKDLLDVVDAYRDATGCLDTTVSNRVFGDSKKVAALRQGADITTGRFNGALCWFSENWPTDGGWPESVSRPDKQVSA